MSYNKQLFMDTLIHPWITLNEILTSSLITQKELALRIWVSPKHINWIINWKDSITVDIALKLEKVLWVSAWFWNNLQKSYDEDLSRLEEKKLLENEEKEVSKYTCYKELVKFWLVENTRVKSKRLLSLLKFFAVSSLWMLWNLEEMAFRKYENKTFSKENFISWLRVWEIIWNKIDVEVFTKQKLKSIIPELKQLTKQEKIDINYLQNLFAKIWIRFIFVKWFERNPVVWLTKKFKWRPFIQISDRGKKADIFWFTLFHEIGHILLHLSNDESIFIDYWEKSSNKLEQEADNFAQSTLINLEAYNEKIKEPKVSILEIAELSNVWTSVVAWRIAHDFSDNKTLFWWNIWSLVNPYRIKLDVFNIQI